MRRFLIIEYLKISLVSIGDMEGGAINSTKTELVFEYPEAGSISGFDFTPNDEGGLRTLTIGAVLKNKLPEFMNTVNEEYARVYKEAIANGATGEQAALQAQTAGINKALDTAAQIAIYMYKDDEANFDFDTAEGNGLLSWKRDVPNSFYLKDRGVYELLDQDDLGTVNYTFAIDMSKIPIPEKLTGLLYMLPGGDQSGRTAWDFLLQLAERVSPLTTVRITLTVPDEFEIDVENLRLAKLYFTIDGVKMTNGLNELEGEYYYAQTNGVLIVGITAWVSQKNDLIPEEGNWYAFDEAGKLQRTGFVTGGDGCVYYYDNCVLARGFTKIGSDYYLFNAGSGKMYKDATMWVGDNAYGVEGGMYYFQPDGKMFVPNLETGVKKIVSENGKLYFTIDGVKMTNGLNELDGEYYYAQANGVLAVNSTIWVSQKNGLIPEKGDWHSFDAEGKLVKTGFVTGGGDTYYYDNNVLALGFTKIGSDYYLFNAGSGKMYKDATMWVGDNAYGVEGGMYYFQPDGKMFVPNLETGVKKIVSENGKLYFTIDGVKMTNGLNELDGEYYYAQANGVLAVNSTIWVSQKNDLIPEKGDWHSFDAEGKLVKTGFVTGGGDTYYYDNNVLALGFTKIGEDYYFFNAGSGKMYMGTTLWVGSNDYGVKSGMYHFDADGKMVQG